MSTMEEIFGWLVLMTLTVVTLFSLTLWQVPI